MIGVLIALAGGLGALARFQTDAFVARLHNLRMPLGTLTVNTLGSGLLGLITGWIAFRSGAPDWAAVLGTGFMGGFTTFSTACVEGVRLVRAGRPAAAIVHTGGGLVLGLVAAALGSWLMSL